jgi:hypothetical protein
LPRLNVSRGDIIEKKEKKKKEKKNNRCRTGILQKYNLKNVHKNEIKNVVKLKYFVVFVKNRLVKMHLKIYNLNPEHLIRHDRGDLASQKIYNIYQSNKVGEYYLK